MPSFLTPSPESVIPQIREVKTQTQEPQYSQWLWFSKHPALHYV